MCGDDFKEMIDNLNRAYKDLASTPEYHVVEGEDLLIHISRLIRDLAYEVSRIQLRLPID